MIDTTRLTKILGYPTKNPQLFVQALTHRSSLNENPKTKESNERLEFLGDSILSVIVSTELYHRFPALPEGQLTNLRSNLVRAKTLAQIAQKLTLGDFLLMSRGEEKSGGRQNSSLLANTFEAVLGAIYLDRGLEAAKTFLEKNLFSQIPKTITQEEIYDFKSRLQELVQEKDKIAPNYKVIEEAGPDHDKTFTVAIYVNKLLLSTGTGKNKQAAQQEAARLAIQQFKR